MLFLKKVFLRHRGADVRRASARFGTLEASAAGLHLYFEKSFFAEPDNHVIPAAEYQEQSYHACVCRSRRGTGLYDLYVE